MTDFLKIITELDVLNAIGQLIFLYAAILTYEKQPDFKAISTSDNASGRFILTKCFMHRSGTFPMLKMNFS